MDKELEKNVIKSFNNVRLDVSKIIAELETIKSKQDEILKKVSRKVKIKPKKVKKTKKKVIKAVKKIASVSVHKKKRKTFVAQRGGKLFHEKNCPFAQNIKPKNKIIFKSRAKALNEGYKPCKCVK
ncbi:hypothetical protein J4433_00210 [Candidatus Pacearchaeota archaeon]|nr:hypothetical protein [Candidatus Pacearchaeota archaeon]